MLNIAPDKGGYQDNIFLIYPQKHTLPASIAQLNARPTGDQEIGGSTPSGSATFFHGD